MAKGGVNFADTENVIEITTLSPEQLVWQWATENKIGEEAVDRLFEEGFTSLEAIRLLDAEDLSRSKITRGQKKLILQCVRVLNGSTGTDETTTRGGPSKEAPIQHVQQPSSIERRAQSASQSVTERSDVGPDARAQSADQSSTNDSTPTMQDGGAHVSMDAYVQGLLSQLSRGQTQARNGFASDLLTSDNTQQVFGALPTGNVNSVPHTVVEGSTNLPIIGSEW